MYSYKEKRALNKHRAQRKKAIKFIIQSIKNDYSVAIEMILIALSTIAFYIFLVTMLSISNFFNI